MKKNKKLSIFIDIIGYFFLFLFLLFLFRTVFTLDFSVSAIPPSLRLEEDLLILKVREVLATFLSLFLTSTLDFLVIKKLLIRLNIDKYKKVIFISCLILSFILLISLIVFYNMYPL